MVPDDAIASGGDLEDAGARIRGPSERPALGAGAGGRASARRRLRRRGGRALTDASIRAAQSRTTPFSMRDLEVTDEGLGLQPSAERDRVDGEGIARFTTAARRS